MAVASPAVPALEGLQSGGAGAVDAGLDVP